jgi:hypothetical protein
METDFVLCEVGAEILVGFKSLNCQSGQVFAYILRPYGEADEFPGLSYKLAKKLIDVI